MSTEYHQLEVKQSIASSYEFLFCPAGSDNLQSEHTCKMIVLTTVFLSQFLQLEIGFTLHLFRKRMQMHFMVLYCI